jgi:mono/diheme cytochrome c family protein
MRIVTVFAAIQILLQVARAEETIDYTTRVRPVLQARCLACHGVLKQKGGLRLDTAALAIKGGKNGAAITPGDPESSALLERVAAADELDRMPPEGEALKPAEIADLRAWIAQGAKAPADEQPERDPREHWAFQTPVRPAIPAVANQDWVKNPIDAFITVEHTKRGLTPQRPADRPIWLRRVSLDLIGLPPTREELDAFVGEGTAEAVD